MDTVRRVVTVEVEDTKIQILDEHPEPCCVEVSRFNAFGHKPLLPRKCNPEAVEKQVSQDFLPTRHGFSPAPGGYPQPQWRAGSPLSVGVSSSRARTTPDTELMGQFPGGRLPTMARGQTCSAATRHELTTSVLELLICCVPAAAIRSPGPMLQL